MNDQLAGITTITSLLFGELLIIKIGEIVVLFLAGFISPGTDIKGSVLFTVQIQALHCIYLLGMN